MAVFHVDSRMAEKITTANEYTDAELLALWREADAQITISGQAYSNEIGSFTAVDAEKIKRAISFYEDRISSASEGLAQNLCRLERA